MNTCSLIPLGQVIGDDSQYHAISSQVIEVLVFASARDSSG
jgi:hypothetical protein